MTEIEQLQLRLKDLEQKYVQVISDNEYLLKMDKMRTTSDLILERGRNLRNVADSSQYQLMQDMIAVVKVNDASLENAHEMVRNHEQRLKETHKIIEQLCEYQTLLLTELQKNFKIELPTLTIAR